VSGSARGSLPALLAAIALALSARGPAIADDGDAARERDRVIIERDPFTPRSFREPAVPPPRSLPETREEPAPKRERPQATLRLSGTGLKPILAHQPDSLRFGQVATGAAVEMPLVLYNRGNDTLRIHSIAGSSEAFAIAGLPPRIAPGDSQTVVVSFGPSVAGDFAGDLVVSSDEPGRQSLSIPASGAGVALSLSVDLDPTAGNQRQTAADGLRPGGKVPVQLFAENAPPLRGFTVRLAFDPLKLSFVPGNFAAGPLVPELIGLADLKGEYVEVGGVALGGGTQGGSGLLGELEFGVLRRFDRGTTVRIPLVIWDRLSGGQQTVQTDIQIDLTGPGGLPSPDFDGNGVVDFDDFFLFADAFGTDDSGFDLDGDGHVGFPDLFLFADEFGKRIG